MVQVLRSMAVIMNELHHLVGFVTERFGLPLSDKALHFWIFGLFGLASFLIVDALFRWIAKWSVSALSFLYTLTLVAILALSIEIQQRLTGQGNMQFRDLTAGLWGFLVLIAVYALIRLLLGWLIDRRQHTTADSEM